MGTDSRTIWEAKLMGLGYWEVERGKIMNDSQVLAYGTRWLFTHMGAPAKKQICVRRPKIYQDDLEI